MNNKIKSTGTKVMHFLTSRRVVLQNKNNATIVDIQLLWFLAVLLLFSGIIIAVMIISLLLGCKISIVETNNDSFDKNRFK